MNLVKVAVVLSGVLVALTATFGQESIPGGTILPVRLDTAISSQASPGTSMRGTVMQEVRLPAEQRIQRGAKVVGEIVAVAPVVGGQHGAGQTGTSGQGARVSIRFESLVLGKRTIPITANLRAIASFMEVESAQVPTSGPDRGTWAGVWTTQQIGGEMVYRGGGPVTDGPLVIGRPVADGVLARVLPEPEEGCRGDVDGNDREQSLWVFSASACGVYGMRNVKIAHAGRDEPEGEITLESGRGKLKIPGGSGMLLRVIDVAPNRTEPKG
jgi:hypothetical protein